MLCYCGSYILSVGECIIRSGVCVSHSEWMYGGMSHSNCVAELCVWEGESFKVFMRGVSHSREVCVCV